MLLVNLHIPLKLSNINALGKLFLPLRGNSVVCWPLRDLNDLLLREHQEVESGPICKQPVLS